MKNFQYDEENDTIHFETSVGKLRIEDMLDFHKEAYEHYCTPTGMLELEAMLDYIVEDTEYSTSEAWAQQVEKQIHQARRGIYNADACFVTKEILEIAVRAASQMPSPVQISEQELLCKNGLMLFEQTIEFDSEDEPGKEEEVTFPVDGILWTFDPEIKWHETDDTTAPGLHVWLIWAMREEEPGDDYGKGLRIVHWYPLELNADLEFSDKRGSVKPVIDLFITLMLLSRQTLSEVSTAQAPRASRRRVGSWRPNFGYLSVITLRKVSRKSEGGEKMDFQYRFLVGEHWRRQWYPSLQKHQWKFIHTYVKGPEDKPLVIRSQRVFHFRR